MIFGSCKGPLSECLRQGGRSPVSRQKGMQSPDDKVRRYLIYLKYWTLNLRAPDGLP